MMTIDMQATENWQMRAKTSKQDDDLILHFKIELTHQLTYGFQWNAYLVCYSGAQRQRQCLSWCVSYRKNTREHAENAEKSGR